MVWITIDVTTEMVVMLGLLALSPLATLMVRQLGGGAHDQS